MKKILIAITLLLLNTAYCNLGSCQDDNLDERSIDREESQTGSMLDNEINSDRNEAESRVSEVETSMNTGGQIQ